MMLVMRIDNADRLENGGPTWIRLDHSGASVGRRSSMDWVLPDPNRVISGHHFDVAWRGGAYVLTDTSTNGTFLSGDRHRISGDLVLKGGERLVVGHYIISVELQDDRAAQPEPWAAPAAGTTGLRQSPAAGGTWGGQSGLQTPSFAARPAEPPRPAQPAAASASRLQQPGGVTPPPAPPPPPAFDDNATILSSPGLRQTDWVPSQPPADIVGRAPAPRPEPGPPSAWGEAAPAPQPPKTEESALPEPPAPLAAPAPAPQAPPPPEPMPEAAAPPSVPLIPEDYDPGRDDLADAMRAFCEAAGLAPDAIAPSEAPRLMAMLGQVTRTATQEIMLMLKSRAGMKLFALSGSNTMLGAADNNPMKFMPDAKQALEVMFATPRPGFLTGSDAFAEALGDIRRHEESLIEALQPALTDVFSGFSPNEIASAAGSRGQHPEALWATYMEMWNAKAEAGEYGLLDAFLQAFARAYGDAAERKSAPPQG